MSRHVVILLFFAGSLGLLGLPGLSGCSCSNPTSIPIPWKKTACLSRKPKCKEGQQLVCNEGSWSCSECNNGELTICYTGPLSTQGVGICKSGSKVCINRFWGPCQNQVRPQEKDDCNNDLDDDCDGSSNEGCACDPRSASRLCGLKIGSCRQGSQKCNLDGKTWGKCQGEILPTKEICDNEDNNCNGQIDESFKPSRIEKGLGKACYSGKGLCRRKGVYICSTDKLQTVCGAKPSLPGPEKCDNKDNNCNGKIDEDWPEKGKVCDNQGNGPCKKEGKFICKLDKSGLECDAPPPNPGTEVCDNKDNDCDGKIDEDWPEKDQVCDNGEKGSCKQNGKNVCKQNQSGTECNAPSGTSTIEICDGKDNDCDGATDNNISDIGSICDTLQLGECRRGTKGCVAAQGTWTLKCIPNKKPESEVCDGKDNDCDGKIDEGFTQVCCKNKTRRPCKNKCGQSGIKICKGKEWGECSASDGDCCQNGSECSGLPD